MSSVSRRRGGGPRLLIYQQLESSGVFMNILRQLFATGFICVALTISARSPMAQTPSRSALVGSWQGTLTVGSQKLRVALNLSEPKPGGFAATLDLPDNGARGLPVEHVTFADRILSFDVNIGAPSQFEGVVSRDLTEILGSLQQGGNFLPLSLTRTDGKTDTNAPKPANPSAAIDHFSDRARAARRAP